MTSPGEASSQPAPERPVRSPCVNVCAMDEHDLCIGCQRTAQEITQWGRMSNDERRQVIAQAQTRARAQGVMR
ncbi:DUF1289 domain-containing protein [Pseudomonas sp. DC3000-4b1]|uniref:DUF1289 domain-containing protein n=1 Tax=unclassified Pseudomonas TaxID=196821 RepID=UPI003CF10DDE